MAQRAVTLCAATVAASLGVLAAEIGSDARRPAVPTSAIALPAPVAPAFRPGPPRRLGARRYRSLWAPVKRRVTVRSAPAVGAPSEGMLEPTTPEGTRNVVAVAARGQDRTRRRWVKVRLAVLPNGSTGWVPRDALGGYGTVLTRLVVDRSALTATLYRQGRPVLRAPVGIGTAAATIRST